MDGRRKIGSVLERLRDSARHAGMTAIAAVKSAAREAGFMHAELLDTLAGDLVYLARAWHEIERAAPPTRIRVDVPTVRMGKSLVGSVST